MFYSCCSNRLKDKKLPQKPYLKGLFPYFPTISNSEKLFELKKNADKSTFFFCIVLKKLDILSV